MIDEIEELMIFYTNNLSFSVDLFKLNILYKYWKTVELRGTILRNKLMNISSNSSIESNQLIQIYIEIIGSIRASNLISRAVYQALHTNKPIY